MLFRFERNGFEPCLSGKGAYGSLLINTRNISSIEKFSKTEIYKVRSLEVPCRVMGLIINGVPINIFEISFEQESSNKQYTGKSYYVEYEDRIDDLFEEIAAQLDLEENFNKNHLQMEED